MYAIANFFGGLLKKRENPINPKYIGISKRGGSVSDKLSDFPNFSRYFSQISQTLDQFYA